MYVWADPVCCDAASLITIPRLVRREVVLAVGVTFLDKIPEIPVITYISRQVRLSYDRSCGELIRVSTEARASMLAC